MKSTAAPGDKAITTALDRSFNKGAKAATDSRDATKRSRPGDSYSGGTKQPIYKGTHDKHFNNQGIPKIKKNTKQMGSGT